MQHQPVAAESAWCSCQRAVPLPRHSAPAQHAGRRATCTRAWSTRTHATHSQAAVYTAAPPPLLLREPWPHTAHTLARLRRRPLAPAAIRELRQLNTQQQHTPCWPCHADKESCRNHPPRHELRSSSSCAPARPTRPPHTPAPTATTVQAWRPRRATARTRLPRCRSRPAIGRATPPPTAEATAAQPAA